MHQCLPPEHQALHGRRLVLHACHDCSSAQSLCLRSVAVQSINLLLPACGGRSAAAATRLFRSLLARSGMEVLAPTASPSGGVACVSGVTVQMPTAAAVNRALYCGFAQVCTELAIWLRLDTVTPQRDVCAFYCLWSTQGSCLARRAAALSAYTHSCPNWRTPQPRVCFRMLTTACRVMLAACNRPPATSRVHRAPMSTCTPTTSATRRQAASACRCGITTPTTLTLPKVPRMPSASTRCAHRTLCRPRVAGNTFPQHQMLYSC